MYFQEIPFFNVVYDVFLINCAAYLIFFNDSANLLSEPMPLCRLCAQEIYDDDLAYLHEENSVDTTMIVDKINACLPISVSKTHI